MSRPPYSAFMLRPQPRLRRATSAPTDLSREAFARSVVRGLGDKPRWLSCRYLYDREGSEIFERITEQPEYYLTRTEDRILAENSARICALASGSTLVELGPGSATKTRHLLRACTAGGKAAHYVPIDISHAMLEETSAALRGEFPSLGVTSIAGSYEQVLPLLGDFSPLTLLFLGSSIGNFNAEELDELLSLLAGGLTDGDQLLLGIDLVKDRETLEAAYNDRAGWSSAFTLNLFARMNRDLGTSVDLDAIEHVATWNEALSRIDIHANVLRDTTISLPEWNREFHLAAGESILVEISSKFRLEDMTRKSARHGLEHVETFTDPEGLFALLLLRRTIAEGERARAVRARLSRELREERERTLEIISPLDDEQLRRQHCSILSPIVWDLGHVGSFEREWTSKSCGVESDSTTPDAGLYDPILQPRTVRGSLPLADTQSCLQTLAEVREATMALVESATLATSDPLLRDGYVFSMIAQHEAQHSETILQSIQLFADRPFEPARRIEPRAAKDCGLAEETFVAAGPFTMGTDDTSAAYDNERPAHLVELASYWIDVTPVSNEVYLRFVEDGGYRRRTLWTRDGWQWLRESKAEHPAQWLRGADGGWNERAFGRTNALDPHRPVVHVSWHEAMACARWLGKRLPTEAEWEKAAAWDLERSFSRRYPWGDAPPSQERANLDQRTFAPSEIGGFVRGRSYYGCHQMLGDVWEWTSSDFVPYPGFRVFPYPEYSQVHFGGRHKVLRGGSWATPAVAIRNTFRNWDLPQRRQIFAGFRCARD